MKRTALIVSLIFLTALIMEAQTTIDDSTEVSGTWTIVNSPYNINGLATVPPGDTLIIDPGVEIRFKTGDDNEFWGDDSVDVGLLYVKGMLIAEGTSSQRITFTHQGDSGYWGCIAFSETADTSSFFKYCKVEYANRISGLESNNYDGALSFRNPKVSISHSEIITNNSDGIFSDHTTFSIHNCIIANNREHGFNLGAVYGIGDTIKLVNNTIIGNQSSGLYTFWTRCQVINCIFQGNAESFDIYNNYTLLSYSLVQEYVLPDYYGWLKIGDGMIYKFNPQLNTDLSLPHYSRCINAGIPDTSGLLLPDSDIAGNNRINLGRIDMGAFESLASNFIYITKPIGYEGFLSGTTQDIEWKCNASNIKLEYTSNGGDTWDDIVASTPNDGIYNWNIPSVENKEYNIRISDVTDNSLFDLCDHNFSVFTSNIPDNTTLTGRLTIEHSPYYINGLATVLPGDTLIIDPGVEIRFKTGNDFSYSGDDSVDVGLLYVKGMLIAEGTSNQRITFTRQGDSGNWGCIAFAPTAHVSSSLKYCKVEYANSISRLESKSYDGALSFRNPKVSISHSEIITNNSDGIDCTNSTPLIQNCLIANNKHYGLGLWKSFNNYDKIIITNNTIVGNGSAGLASNAKCKIVNNIFWNNAKSFYLYANTSIASYNLVQEDNPTETDLIIGEGMIYNYSPQLGSDFYPQYNSAVINAGTPDTTGLYLSGFDFWGNNRINHNRVDIGAVESDALKFICLLAPNGKEGFLPGTNLPIRWRSNVDNLKLEYTSDNGSNWVEITGNTPNDGLYNWIIPSVESRSFNIRISDVTDNSVFDVCDDNFAIFTSNIPDSTILSGILTIEHSPYYIDGLATVPLGETLVIEPGVEIRFKTGNDFSYTADDSVDVGLLYINGNLIAEGTSNQKITFTRQGDSGNWGCIAFSATADTSSSFKYCNLEYGNSISSLESKQYNGALSFRNPKVSISHSEIINNKSCGIYSDYSTLLIQNCLIANNEKDGIYLLHTFTNNDTIIIANNTIVGNALTGLHTWYAKCRIVNNIFWNNGESFDLYGYKSIASYNLIKEKNLTETDLIIGEGMIYNLDPQFVNSDNNDYHLNVTSPGIDAGDPGYIYSMEPYENGGRINNGAYGNTDEATITENLPRITYLSTNSGRMFGRDTIIIKGTQFLSNRGSGTVKFGSTGSTEYIYWSEDSIVCITPPHLPGLVNINIINNDDKKGFGENCFSFLPPVLNKPDPIFSNTSGGEQIIFSGELFGHSQNGMQVLFDQTEAPIYHTWKDDTIILNCPSHPEGLVDLIFKVNDSINYNFNETFLYSEKPLTELCGEISDTLFKSQTYLLTCPVTIPEDQTLIIEPGVLIIAQYDEENPISITSNGIIKAIGTESDTIKIISFPQYKGTWEGIILNYQGFFDYCIIKNGINGILVGEGGLELKNSTISNNLNAGLDLAGNKTSLTIKVENTNLLDNQYGIYARASNYYVSVTLASSNILNNNESGIDLYSHGHISGIWVPVSRSSNINFTLKNSVVSNSGSNAIKIRSYGFSASGSPSDIYRSGNVKFISENSIIFNNEKGIIAQRESKSYCRVNTEFYNTVMYNNNSVIEMDADEVFIYNSNVWDNGISGNPIGICDSLVVAYSDLNSLENIPNGSNNISTNPMYISPESSDFHLSEGSPCIDAGSNQFVSSETDFDGKVRIWNATDKDSAIVDIGAFEFGTPCFAATIVKEICEGDSYQGYTESGIYQFDYADVSGCDSVILVNLYVNPVPAKPTITASGPTTFCDSDSVKLTSSAADSYLWSNGKTTQDIIVKTAGDYTVAVTDSSSCTSPASDITSLTVNPLPAKPTITQNLNTLTSNIPSGNQWYLYNTLITDAYEQKYTVTSSGDYHVVVTNEFGCASTPSNIITVIYSSLEDLGEYKLEVYPNPTYEFISIEGLPGTAEVEIAIYNLSGNIVKKKITSSKTVQINIRDLEQAIYLLIINNQSKQAIKIIKN